MPRFRIAHLREQGADMIIVPLDRSFGLKSRADQQSAVMELQQRAMAARLRGRVVPVWDDGSGGMNFIAPQNWHPFFESIGLNQVRANLNKELFW